MDTFNNKKHLQLLSNESALEKIKKIQNFTSQTVYLYIYVSFTFVLKV